jgi:hypothetical protein
LWILAQNKEYIQRIHEIWCDESKDKNNLWKIIGDDYSILGGYGSKERAKEVLKEIFNAIKSGSNCYIMPEK